MSQLRPIGPIAIDPDVGTDILPVDVDRARGTITKLRLFVNNRLSNTNIVTITILGLQPIVLSIPPFFSEFVFDGQPIQQPDSTSSQVQVHVDGDNGEGGEAFTVFGSFEVT